MSSFFSLKVLALVFAVFASGAAAEVIARRILSGDPARRGEPLPKPIANAITLASYAGIIFVTIQGVIFLIEIFGYEDFALEAKRQTLKYSIIVAALFLLGMVVSAGWRFLKHKSLEKIQSALASARSPNAASPADEPPSVWEWLMVATFFLFIIVAEAFAFERPLRYDGAYGIAYHLYASTIIRMSLLFALVLALLYGLAKAVGPTRTIKYWVVLAATAAIIFLGPYLVPVSLKCNGLGLDDDKNISRCSIFLSMFPLSPNELLYRGDSHRRKNSTTAAISDLSEAIALDPTYAQAYNLRGIVYYSDKSYDRALEDFSKSAELRPREAGYHSNRGDAFLSRGDAARAVESYSRAIQLNPNYARAYSSRADSKLSLGSIDEAIADFNKALQIEPNNVSHLNHRRSAFERKGDIPRALDDFDRIMKLDPAFSKTLALSTSLSSALRRRGSARIAAGDPQGGSADIEAANRPGSSRAILRPFSAPK